MTKHDPANYEAMSIPHDTPEEYARGHEFAGEEQR